MARMTGKRIRRKNRRIKKEIELRFTLEFIPEYILRGIEEGKYPKRSIRQVYLEDKEGTRLRSQFTSWDRRFTKTIKKGEGVSRSEDECGIQQRKFLERIQLKPCDLQKDRYYIPWGKWVIELNFFVDRLVNGLRESIIYNQAEVEFKTMSGVKKFVKPEWFDRDVTHDSRHSNYSIAKNGAPAKGDNV